MCKRALLTESTVGADKKNVCEITSLTVGPESIVKIVAEGSGANALKIMGALRITAVISEPRVRGHKSTVHLNSI